MSYIDKYNLWLQKATDEQVQQSLKDMAGNDDLIAEAFSGNLQFGTGGLRGIMTAGTDRMNVYTVYRATEGIARYMLHYGKKSCAVTYDSRINSQLFAHVVCATLASHGITCYVTDGCMPTPYLSFMVRHYGCDMGINVTASHNPKQYNGYKVYDDKGCQLTDNDANEVTSYIEGVELFQCELPLFDQYKGSFIRYADQNCRNAYVNSVLAQALDKADGLNVTYTPLNGAGYQLVPHVLQQVGVTDLSIVSQQSAPNGNFDTCPYPNPEKAEALSLAINLAKQTASDVVIATDPDCDRLGVVVNAGDKFVQLSGNEVGILLVDYVLSTLQAQNALPTNPIVVKTIVTSPMVNAVASYYGAQVVDVLTGFKYIGDVIAKLESKNQTERYLFGFEESCGYLRGTYVRDKDGVVASMLIACLASKLKKQGLTLVDKLQRLYEQHGHFFQHTASYRFEGLQGVGLKNQLLALLRANGLDRLGQSPVVDSCDFTTQTKYDLPKADVLRYISADGSQLIVRPSGTEPLIKCYVTVSGTPQSNRQRFEAIMAQMDAMFGNK